jgi:hypothetical protein
MEAKVTGYIALHVHIYTFFHSFSITSKPSLNQKPNVLLQNALKFTYSNVSIQYTPGSPLKGEGPLGSRARGEKGRGCMVMDVQGAEGGKIEDYIQLRGS